MSVLRPDIGERLRDAVRFLPMAIILFVVSRVLFDLLAGRSMFWSTSEELEAFLWKALLFIPVILFALLVAAQRNQSRN